MKKVIAYIMIAAVVVGSLCVGSLSCHIAPARIDKDAVEFVEAAGIGDANDYRGFLYPSLAELTLLQADLVQAHQTNAQMFRHLMEDEEIEWRYLTGVVDYDMNAGLELEDAIFNPTTGALAVGLSMLGIGAGGYLGMIRKRKRDFSPEEHEAALFEVKGEVTSRDRALIQLVTQIQKVIDSKPATERDAYLKELKADQLPETRAAVKAVKSQL